ncbi:MAG: hypothetical protein AB9903_05760 [Vulcanimicrobiota bacterium]
MKSPGAKRGIALTSTLLLIIVFLIIGVSIVGLTTMQSRYSMKAGFDIRARETALAGIRILQDTLSSVENWNDISKTNPSQIATGLVNSYGYTPSREGIYQQRMFNDYLNELEILEVKNDAVIAISKGYILNKTPGRHEKLCEKTYKVVYKKNRFRYTAVSLTQNGTGMHIPYGPNPSAVKGDLCCLTNPSQTACIIGDFGHKTSYDEDDNSTDGSNHVIITDPNHYGGGYLFETNTIHSIPGRKKDRSQAGTSVTSHRSEVPGDGDAGGTGDPNSDDNDGKPDGQGQTGGGYEPPSNGNDDGGDDGNGDGGSKPHYIHILVYGSVFVMQDGGTKAKVEGSRHILNKENGVQGIDSAPLSMIDYTEISSLAQNHTASGNQTVTLDSRSFEKSPVILNAGVYTINDFDVSWPLSIRTVGGTAYLFVNNNISIKGELEIQGDPRSFIIFSRGSQVTIGGTATAATTSALSSRAFTIKNLFLEAPNANISIINADLTGSVIGNTIQIMDSTLAYPTTVLGEDREKGRALIISLEEMATSR